MNERRNSILMTRHYPDLGSASDWLKQISQAFSWTSPLSDGKIFNIANVLQIWSALAGYEEVAGEFEPIRNGDMF